MNNPQVFLSCNLVIDEQKAQYHKTVGTHMAVTIVPIALMPQQEKNRSKMGKSFCKIENHCSFNLTLYDFDLLFLIKGVQIKNSSKYH